MREHVVGDVLWSYASNEMEAGIEGTIINISETGMSIFSGKETKKGDVLKIESKEHWNGYRYAAVRWCGKISEGLYRMGLDFKT